LNRVINKYDLNMFYVAGPGHGGPAIVGNVYLEGTWSDVYPNVTQDEAGLKELFKQFSFPGGISSHVAPTTPGSIHEGGELGYSLSHAFGAAFDNPGLIVACVIGDGEAETGPLATSWQSNKFLDPVTDGAVLPILHLNGYKISNPTILARIEREELEQFLRGCGWAPLFVEGDDPDTMHELMATAMESAIEEIHRIQSTARNQDNPGAPALADDCAAIAQGLDGTQSRRWVADRGDVSCAPGTDARGSGSSGSRPAARELDEKLQTGGTVRCKRPTRRRVGGSRPEGRPTHGRQPTRQRRLAAARS
jgi:phosphoketolase